jgi:hypothetical protein
MFADKTRRLVPLASGVGLLTCPYFVSDTIALLGICLVLAALPLFIVGRERHLGQMARA